MCKNCGDRAVCRGLCVQKMKDRCTTHNYIDNSISYKNVFINKNGILVMNRGKQSERYNK